MTVTRDDILTAIDEATWEEANGVATLNILDLVIAQLQLRPILCDKGNMQLTITGIDDPSLPRYFFTGEEADEHTRNFLRLYVCRERTCPLELNLPQPEPEPTPEPEPEPTPEPEPEPEPEPD